MRYSTGVWLVLGAGLLWSFQALMIRQIDEAGPWAILVWRSLAMLPMMIGFLAWRSGGAVLPALRGTGMAGVLGGLGLVAAMAGAILAFQTTTIANAAFLFAAAPLLSALLARLILAEPIAPRTGLAIAMALLGIFVMVRDGLAGGAMLGNVAALVSALGFAAFSVALRWKRQEDSLPASVLGAAFSVVAGLGAAAALGQPVAVSLPDLTWCVLMGMFTLSGGMILYTLGSKVVPSGELTLMSNLEVILAPFWVWLLLGESASAATFAGGALVLVAILVNAFGGQALAAVKGRRAAS